MTTPSEKTFPTLYKKTATGAIQFWSLLVRPLCSDNPDALGEIVTTYGQEGTPNPQTTCDVISKGKNPGKKNETTPFEQALKEGEAQWLKKKKKGYVADLSAAEVGAVDTEVITGGVSPMLAEKYAEQGHKIVFPCFGQPKFDGARCVAVIEHGRASLWTRTRKPITSVPHIVGALEKAFPGESVCLDGELYNHDLKADFERLMSLVRKDSPAEGHTDVQFHVYDLAETTLSFGERLDWLMSRDSAFTNPLVLTNTEIICDATEVPAFFEKCRELGYEGAMLRNAAGKYSNRRSPDLQKVKAFDDAEFEIAGIEEGRGKLAGHVGSFVCKTDTGATFNAKLKGSLEHLKVLFEQATLWTGKRLVVQYQGLTSDGVPRFPIGLRIRDSVDF